MTKLKKQMEVIKKYYLFAMDFDDKPNDAFVGFVWVIVIISSPVWVWGWISYKILKVIGKRLDGVVEEEYEVVRK